MTPITDPRPFAAVLNDWIERHGGSAYAVASRPGRPGLLSATEATVGNWRAGKSCLYEREVRALMTLVDEGRA